MTVDGSANAITYDVIGPMGGAAKLKALKKATLLQINNGKQSDITSKVNTGTEGKLVVEFSKAEVVDLPWTSHLIMFEFESSIFINKTFEVKSKIVEEIGVSVS